MFNDKMRQILNNIQSISITETCTTKLCSHSEKASTELDSLFDDDEQVKTADAASSIRPPNLFYDLQAKNFGADKVEDIIDEKYFTTDIFATYRAHQQYAQYVLKLII